MNFFPEYRALLIVISRISGANFLRDSIERLLAPDVFGMSQFADGGWSLVSQGVNRICRGSL